MIHSFKRHALAIGLSSLLLSATAFADTSFQGQRQGPPWPNHAAGQECRPAHGMMHHHMGGGMPMLDMIQRHAYALKLSDKQASEIAVWRNQHIKTAVETRRALRKDFGDLHQAALEGRDRAALDAIGTRIDQGRAKLLAMRLDQIELIKRVLTPEQWKQATDWAKRFEHRKMGHPDGRMNTHMKN